MTMPRSSTAISLHRRLSNSRSNSATSPAALSSCGTRDSPRSRATTSSVGHPQRRLHSHRHGQKAGSNLVIAQTAISERTRDCSNCGHAAYVAIAKKHKQSRSNCDHAIAQTAPHGPPAGLFPNIYGNCQRVKKQQQKKSKQKIQKKKETRKRRKASSGAAAARRSARRPGAAAGRLEITGQRRCQNKPNRTHSHGVNGAKP